MVSTSSAAAASAPYEAWKQSDNAMDFCDVVGGSGPNKDLRCKLCKHEFKGSGTRAYEHLVTGGPVAKCTAIEPAAVQRLKAAKAAKDADKAAKKRKEGSDRCVGHTTFKAPYKGR